MTIKVSFATLGILMVGALTACSTSTSGPDDSGTTSPGDTSTATDTSTPTEASTESETSTTEEASTTEDGGAPDTGTTADSAADGGMCAVGLDTGSTDCDTCAATSCCTQLTTCDAADDAGVNDAGLSACEQLLMCINDVNGASDGGTDSGTDVGETTCEVAPFTTDEDNTANAVFTCIRTNCASQCPGL